MRAFLLAGAVYLFSVASLAAENPAAQATNHLALVTLRLTEGNRVLSPWSLQQGLAMAYAGARGSTATQMAAALGYPADSEALHGSFRELRDAILAGGAQNRAVNDIRTANRIFIDDKEANHIREEWKKVVRDFGGAEIGLMDLTNYHLAEKTINRWVSEQTDGKIGSVIPPGGLAANPPASLVIANALFCALIWDERFTEQLTTEQPFAVNASRSVAADLMFKQHQLNYAHPQGYQIAALPYAGGRLQFVVLLPDDADGLGNLEKALTPQVLSQCVSLPKREVRLWLPRLHMDSEPLKMKTILAKLGMIDAFSEQADFSGIDSGHRLEIAEVYHRTFLEVDENGAKAAASTAVILTPKNGHPREVPHENVKADHPFLFMIQHVASGACLFIGRVTEPLSNPANHVRRGPPKK